MTIVGKTEITHIFDYESDEEKHIKEFKNTLDWMKEAQASGKNIKYHLGYSNFTFELWMILYMSDCNTVLSHRRQYLNPLNRAYGEKFENLVQYKEEKNFKRILSKLTLEHVKQAIRRSEVIMRRNETMGNKPQQYKGYYYYKENPSLAVWEQIKQILQDCGLV